VTEAAPAMTEGDPRAAAGVPGDEAGRNADDEPDAAEERSADDRADAGGDPGAGGERRSGARWVLLASVAAAALAADQITKAWAVSALADGHVVDIVGSLRLRLTLNYGAAFSLTNGRGALISLLALAVVAVLLRTGRHERSVPMAVALGLVVGGAVGNLADRAFRAGDGLFGGGVVDFVDLQWWPVFNVADVCVVVGACLLFVVQWREADDEGADPAGDGDT
jgi:signal peptidase II